MESAGLPPGTSEIALPPVVDEAEDVIDNNEAQSEGNERPRGGIDEDAMFDSLFGEEEDSEDASSMGDIAKATRQLAQKKRKEREEQLNNADAEAEERNEDQPSKRRRTSEKYENDDFVVNENENDDPLGNEEKTEEDYGREFANDVLNPMRSRTRRKTTQKFQADESVVQGFVGKMEQAHREDKDSLKNKKPGLAKVKLLPEVQSFFQKQFVRESLFTEKNDGEGSSIAPGGVSVLKQCRKWLTPLPDGSLPNLKIRDGLLKSLEKLELGEELLRKSGIGKSIMVLSKHRTESSQNKKICRALIQKWSRPIFAISSAYTQLEAFETEAYEQRKQSGKKLKRRSYSQGFDDVFESPSGSQENVVPRYTMRPQKVRMDYVIRPTATAEWNEERERKVNKDQIQTPPKPLRIHEKIQSLKTPKRSKARAVTIGVNKLNKS